MLLSKQRFFARPIPCIGLIGVKNSQFFWRQKNLTQIKLELNSNVSLRHIYQEIQLIFRQYATAFFSYLALPHLPICNHFPKPGISPAAWVRDQPRARSGLSLGSSLNPWDWKWHVYCGVSAPLFLNWPEAKLLCETFWKMNTTWTIHLKKSISALSSNSSTGILTLHFHLPHLSTSPWSTDATI